jgi:mRNA-degrading endonuclease RelE of RelBE toxin-antitoxin system
MSFQVIFSPKSASEMSALPKPLQLQILSEFNFLPEDLKNAKPGVIGTLEREGRQLYRYRAKDYRIYFEKSERGLIIHRILNKNTLKDFLFRSKLPMAEAEDEALQKNAAFWEMIDGRA